MIDQLQRDHEIMLSERENKIKTLKIQLVDLNKYFLKIKKDLQKDLQTDEKKMHYLIECTTNSVQHLEKLAKKGEQIKNLANTCKKYETEREKVSKWLPISQEITKYDGDDIDFEDSIKIISEQLKDIGNIQGTLHATDDYGN